MPTLTLTPYRCASPTSFAPGSFAYCIADRPARVGGVLVTPAALVDIADDDGRLDFNIPSSSSADDRLEFKYTVAAFDPEAQRMWIYSVVMPNEDAEVHDLVAQTFDLDDHMFIPVTCSCGPRPVNPLKYVATIETDEEGEASYLFIRHADSADEEVSLPDLYQPEEPFSIYIEADNSTGPFDFDIRNTQPTVYKYDDTPSSEGGGWYLRDTSNASILKPSDLTAGNTITIHMNFGYYFTVTDFNAPGPSVSEIAEYQVAKAAYDACVAAGGEVEEGPVEEPEEEES